MKRDIHPSYEPVVFRDINTGTMFRTRSTATSSATVELDGEELPVIDVEVTADSHPFWTGKGRTIDTEGRIERFRRRYAKKESR